MKGNTYDLKIAYSETIQWSLMCELKFSSISSLLFFYIFSKSPILAKLRLFLANLTPYQTLSITPLTLKFMYSDPMYGDAFVVKISAQKTKKKLRYIDPKLGVWDVSGSPTPPLNQRARLRRIFHYITWKLQNGCIFVYWLK